MSVERGLFLVKPDALINGGSEEAKNRLQNKGLTINQEIEVELNPEQIRQLYPERTNTQWEECLIAYLTGGPCLVLLTEGENAIEKALEVKGKTWAGDDSLRGDEELLFSQNFIHNGFHCPDSAEEARKIKEVLLKKPNLLAVH